MFRINLLIHISVAFLIITLYTDAPASPTLENDLIRLVFDENRGHLLSFFDKQTEIELLSNREQAWPVIFGFNYRLQGGDLKWTDSNGAHQYTYAFQDSDTGLIYSECWQYQWENATATITLTVCLTPDSSFSTWKFKAFAQDNVTLESFNCPLLPGIGTLGDEPDDDRLLVPSKDGRLFINPLHGSKNWNQTYPSGFANMQFMAYFDSQAGFYLASLDDRGLSKGLSWDSRGRDWAAWAINYLGLSGTGNEKSFQVDTTLGVFHGNWTKAASIYRDWAQEQSWAKSTIESKGTPTWLTNIGISKDYYVHLPDRSWSDWVQKMQEHVEFFCTPTVGLLHGWEHGGAWASGDYFPPIEGWQTFDQAMFQVKSTDSRLLAYINANTVLMDSPTWKLEWANSEALYDTSGCIVTNGNSVFMCLESDRWLEYLRDTTATLAAHDVSIVQLDGFPWGALQTCYAQGHRHGSVLGCGARPYEVAYNFQIMREKLKSDYPDLALSGEGGAELFLPGLDIFHSRDCWAEVKDTGTVGTGLVQVVPLFQFVYHPNIIFLDHYNLGLWDFLGSTNYHNLAIGRCFIWGGFCSYNMQDWLSDQGYQPIFNLLKRCAQARIGFLRDFLVFGQMLPPPQVSAPMIEVEAPDNTFKGQVPSVLSSAWQSAQGDIAVIVLNIGENKNPLKITIPLSAYSQYLNLDSKLYFYKDNDLINQDPELVGTDPSDKEIEIESLQFAAFIFSS